MTQLKLMSQSDLNPKLIALDEAFLTAISTPVDQNPAEEHLLKLIQNHPNWIYALKDDYKLEVIKSRGINILDSPPRRTRCRSKNYINHLINRSFLKNFE